jgi:hypothetical protein
MLSLFKALDLNGDGLLTKEELLIGKVVSFHKKGEFV